MFPYWEQSTNSLTSCRFSRHSTVSAWRLIECLTCWRRGWDSARSLRELPANMPLRGCVGRTGFESPYLTRRENKKAPRGGLFIFWRRGWDSNPRYGRTVHLISNQAHSTTLAPLRDASGRQDMIGDANCRNVQGLHSAPPDAIIDPSRRYGKPRLRLLLIISLAGLIGTCLPGQRRSSTRSWKRANSASSRANSPTSYTISPDGPTGPEYDLVQAFAEELGVTLVIETVESVSEILPLLLSGQAHMAAAGLSITDSRREFLNFGHPYESVDVHLIYKLGTGQAALHRRHP